MPLLEIHAPAHCWHGLSTAFCRRAAASPISTQVMAGLSHHLSSTWGRGTHRVTSQSSILGTLLTAGVSAGTALATQVSSSVPSSCGWNLKNNPYFFKHKCALIPFNSADSTQLFCANGRYFFCKIAWKYNRSYGGERTNTFLSTSEMSHLSSGLCTELWHQKISFISFAVKLDLTLAPNCCGCKWRVSLSPNENTSGARRCPFPKWL